MENVQEVPHKPTTYRLFMLIRILKAHCIDYKIVDGVLWAIDEQMDGTTYEVSKEWIIITAQNIKEFLGYHPSERVTC
jgi:cyanate lyase